MNSSISVWRSLPFHIVGRFHRWSLYLRMLRKGLQSYRSTALLVFFSVVSKVFEKLVNNRTVDHLKKCGLFSDIQYGFRSSWSTADLLTVVSDRIARALSRSGTTRAVALHLSSSSTNVSLMESEIKYLALFFLFSVIGSFEWFWMKSYHKNIQLMLVFLKATFLMMLSVILLSMLMILLCILSVIRHLICGNNLNELLNLNLIYETL